MESVLKYWPMAVVVVAIAADFAVSEYRLDAMQEKLTKIEKQLSPEAYQDYAVIKKTVKDNEKDILNLQGRVWELELGQR